MAGGQREPWPPNFFETIGFLEMVMFHQNLFRFLLLVKTKALQFIRESLNLAPLLCRCHDASESN